MKHKLKFALAMCANLLLVQQTIAQVQLQDKEKIRDSLQTGVRNQVYVYYSTDIFQLKNDKDPVALQKQALRKFGEIGEQVVWDCFALLHYTKDFDEWFKFKSKLIEKYPSYNPALIINNDSWHVFTNSDEKSKLEKALSWIKSVIAAAPYTVYYDTYANLLYKLGRRKEALAAMEHGFTLDTGPGSLENCKANYEKIKNQQPTWPAIKK